MGSTSGRLALPLRYDPRACSYPGMPSQGSMWPWLRIHRGVVQQRARGLAATPPLLLPGSRVTGNQGPIDDYCCCWLGATAAASPTGAVVSPANGRHAMPCVPWEDSPRSVGGIDQSTDIYTSDAGDGADFIGGSFANARGGGRGSYGWAQAESTLYPYPVSLPRVNTSNVYLYMLYV